MSSAPALPTSVCVVVYGSDELLLGTRSMVLEKAGYTVFSAREAPEVERIMLSEQISVLVLCHTLSQKKCEAALEFAESRNLAIRSLVLTAGITPCSERAHDTVLSAFDGPRRLVETVQKLLENAQVASSQ